jgi:ApaG protein
MNTLTTCGVSVTVKQKFDQKLSDLSNSSFFFRYSIKITNNSESTVQLISRKWEIFDSLNSTKIVEGLGVIGEQPILKPGESFSYESGCELFSEIGSMKGLYSFKNIETQQNLRVLIPKFDLYYPGILN